MAAAPITEVAATVALGLAVVVARASVSAPAGDGGVDWAWAAVMGRNTPMAPPNEDANKWRLPISECSTGMVVLLISRKGNRTLPTHLFPFEGEVPCSA
jgi:hypothetical protein